MTSKYIKNIRRVALTDEIIKKLKNIKPKQDKASIGGSRGIGTGLYDPCQLLYTNTDGIYSFANIIDGVSNLKITDEERNHCIFVNTIIEMQEIDTDLQMILKPDGQFLQTGDFMYTSSSLTDTPPTPNYVYDTPEGAYHALAEKFGATEIPDGLIETNLRAEDIGSYNFETTYPVFFALYAGEVGFFCEYIYGIPATYDFTIDSQSEGGEPPFIDEPLLNQAAFPPFDDRDFINPSPGNYYWFSSMSQGNPGVFPNLVGSFQLAIDIAASRLWKPNPADTNAPLKYSAGVSVVNFDFGAGYTRKGTVRPAKDGGFMLYETSSSQPINNIYVFRQDRTLAAIIPALQINSYLP